MPSAREAGASKIRIQRSDRVIRNHVQRTGDRKCGHRRAAGQRLELDHTEGIGEAGENKDVGRGQVGGQIGARFFAKEFSVGIFLLQRRSLRSIPDHHLGSRADPAKEMPPGSFRPRPSPWS